jgi:hypothetical protein
MPIWLRKFTFEKIKEYYEKKREAEEEAANKAKGIQKAESNIARPNISPTYTTKVPQK